MAGFNDLTYVKKEIEDNPIWDLAIGGKKKW